MTLGDKIAKLRKENNLTQEQLAQLLGVSRQAIGKWESDLTYPETEKLIRMGEVFDCSLDYLLKEQEQTPRESARESDLTAFFRGCFHKKKSDKTLFGMPLWHIGKQARSFLAIGLNARGVIAVGLKAQGVISLGLLSVGVLSFGMLALGALSFGLFALGLAAAGCFSGGIVAAGAICLGVLSIGAIAVGDFSVGALAVGRYFALGDHARGAIALGDTRAVGSVLQKFGDLTPQDIAEVRTALDETVPAWLAWLRELVKALL